MFRKLNPHETSENPDDCETRISAEQQRHRGVATWLGEKITHTRRVDGHISH